MHPFNRRLIIDTSKSNDIFNEYKKSVSWGCSVSWGDIYTSVQKIKKTPIEEYDYETCRNAIAGRRYVFCKVLVIAIGIVLVAGLVFLFKQDLVEIIRGTAFLLPCVFICYLLLGRNAVYSRWTLLANRLSLCTEYVDYWVFCTLLALSSFVVFLLIVFDM